MNKTSSIISPARAESIARFNAAVIAWDGEAYLAASVAHAADIKRIAAQDSEIAARSARIAKAEATYERAIAASYIEAAAIILGVTALGLAYVIGLGLI